MIYICTEVGQRPATEAEAAAILAEQAAASAQKVPDSVPMAEARKVLRAAGLLEKIQKLVTAAGPDAVDDFEYQPRIRRNHPLVLAAIQQKIMTAELADHLFVKAATMAGQK